MKQKLLVRSSKKRREPDKDNGNRILKGIQKFKTSEGCPHLCPFCYESDQLKIFEIPEDWNKNEIDGFRARCALHNQSVGFELYPNMKRAERFIRKFRYKRSLPTA